MLFVSLLLLLPSAAAFFCRRFNLLMLCFMLSLLCGLDAVLLRLAFNCRGFPLFTTTFSLCFRSGTSLAQFLADWYHFFDAFFAARFSYLVVLLLLHCTAQLF